PAADAVPAPAAAHRDLGAARPDQRPLRGADQPDHSRDGPGPRPAGGRGLGPFPATLGREVRLRLLPSQPGRLPRLDPCAARRRPGDGRPPEPATGPGRLTERPPSLLPRLRLVPGRDDRGPLHLAPLVQDVPELAERLVLVGSHV